MLRAHKVCDKHCRMYAENAASYHEHDEDEDVGNEADHVEGVRDLRHAVKVKAACIAGRPSRALAQKSL